MNKKGVTTMNIDFANTLKLGDFEVGRSEGKELGSPKHDQDIAESIPASGGEWDND